MTATTEPPPRILTLDIVRGIAVMGILAMNILIFAMPAAAYMNPLAYGLDGDADMASWVFSFIFVDGKMRGLFSFLFGASMLLVIQKAEAKGESPAGVHYSRMIWLLVFGLLHFYFIWFGDILSIYATIGMIAWFFRDMEPKRLIFWGCFFLGIQLLFFAASTAGYFLMSQAAAAPDATAEILKGWAEMKKGFAIPTDPEIARDMALYRGGWLEIARHKLTETPFMPITMILLFAA